MNDNRLQFQGAAGLITGGGSGIGLASAAALVADGMSVTIMGRNEERLAGAAEQLRSTAPDGVEIRVHAGDVTREDAVADAVAAASAVTGRLDACVAAAGDGTLGPIIGMPAEEWQRVLDVTLTGVFLTFKHAGATMAAAGSGAMVAISSIAATATHRYMGPYSVAKAGIDMLVRTTADELGPAGVRVNAVNPGIIRTDLVSMITPEDEIGQSYLANMPLGRFGEVEDVAPLVSFLCSDAASFITGVTVPIDGGHHLRRGPDYSSLATQMYPDTSYES